MDDSSIINNYAEDVQCQRDENRQWGARAFATIFTETKYVCQLCGGSEFLDNFARKDSEGFFMPVNSEVLEFVKWYYNLFETIGRETL